MLLLLSVGCGSEVPALEQTPEAEGPIAGTAYAPANAGRVTGLVTWNGPIPNPPGFLYGVARADGLGFEFRTAKNPNRPQINPKSRAVANAVVFLRGIDAAAGKPWDLPAASVEVADEHIVVVQGDRRCGVGFVRHGDTVSFCTTEQRYHVIRGRGDAFFGITLPEPNRPVSRKLTTSGRVELSSGTGLYWARANLFVADHPYFTVTDQHGRFTLDNVPAGKAELVVWLPNWEPKRQERDPDSTTVARQSYGAPIERATAVTIQSQSSSKLTVSLP